MFWKLVTWPLRAVNWLRRARPIRFTRFGLFYILFSLALGAAAINTGNNLLYLMLGLLLGFILISGFLSDSCIWGLETDFQAVGDFYAGQPAEWDLEVHKGRFPAILVLIEAFWPQEVTRHLFYWVPRHGRQRQRLRVTPKRRGMFKLERIRTSTRFPFGLFEKSHQSAGPSWVVFPALKSLPLNLLRAAGLSLSNEPAGRKGWGATPFDLREYQTGDSSKRIHWKSSAKRGELMVTEMEEESAAGQMVVVSTWPTNPADLEAFISFVASLIYTLNRQGESIGLQAPGAHFKAERSQAHLKKILTYLALVEPGQDGLSVSTGKARSTRSIDALSLWQNSGLIR